jgi:hypothetical protein
VCLSGMLAQCQTHTYVRWESLEGTHNVLACSAQFRAAAHGYSRCVSCVNGYFVINAGRCTVIVCR